MISGSFSEDDPELDQVDGNMNNAFHKNIDNNAKLNVITKFV